MHAFVHSIILHALQFNLHTSAPCINLCIGEPCTIKHAVEHEDRDTVSTLWWHHYSCICYVIAKFRLLYVCYVVVLAYSNPHALGYVT